MSDPNVTSDVSVPRNLFPARWWWKTALPVGLLLAVTAVVSVYLLFEPQYEASALLEIRRSPYLVFDPGEAEVLAAYFRTQMEIIHSRWILGLTVAQEEIKQLPEIRKQQDPIQWLRKRVKVVQANGPDAFEIKYAGPDPESAALIVNEITCLYLITQALEEEDKMKSTLRIVAALTEEIQSREKDVRMLRTQVQTAAQQVSGREPETARPDPSSPAKFPAELQARLVAVQVDRAMLSVRIKAGEEGLRLAEAAAKTAADATPKNDAGAQASAPPVSAAPLSKEESELRDAVVRRAIAEHADVRQRESMLLSKRMELEQIRRTTKLGKVDSSYKRLEREIAAYEKGLEELKQKMVAPIQREVESTLRARRSESVNSEVTILAARRAELEQMHSKLRTHEIAEKNMRSAYADQLTKFSTQVRQFSEEDRNLTVKKDEWTQAQKVIERITERQIALQTERAEPPYPQVVWLQPASVPAAPVESLPYRNMILAGIIAFCLPYAAGFVALVLRHLRRLIRQRWLNRLP